MPSYSLTKNNTVVRDTSIQKNLPTQGVGGSGELVVGVAGSAEAVTRSLLFFDLGSIPNDVVIESAILEFYQTDAAYTKTVNVHKLTQGFTDSTNWNTHPSFEEMPSASFLSMGYGNVQVSVDIKNLVQRWVNGEANYGLMLKLEDESILNTIRHFQSFENTGQKPTLTIQYTIPTTGKKQVEYVGAGTAASNNGTVNLALPSGVQDGDLLVAQLNSYSTFGALPSGWSLAKDVNFSSVHWVVAYKIKTPSDGKTAFSNGGTNAIAGRIHAFRNVKSVLKSSANNVNSAVGFYPPAETTTIDKALFAIFNSATNGAITWTPPLSYTEVPEVSVTYPFQMMYRYMHTSRSQTTNEMTAVASATAIGESMLLVLEPITNNPPLLTLSSPAENRVLSEGNNQYPVAGSASDNDSGNVVTIYCKIDNGPKRALQSGVSNGSAPISFSKTLIYNNKRIWDGTTDITGVDLAENTNHTLTVWSEDDQGGKSADVTRTFQVIWNRPPVISGTNEDLGTITTPPTKSYSVTDPEGESFTITEKIDDTVIRTFPGVAGQQEEITIPHDLWIRLDLDNQHSLTVEATDSKGMTSTRTFTFMRFETHIELMLNFDNPDVQAHFTPDGMPERILVTLERYIPEGAEIESVKVTNNNLDPTPTWEDMTSAVKGGRGYLFTNKTKTAAEWQINIWVTIAKGTAIDRVLLNGFGGAYD